MSLHTPPGQPPAQQRPSPSSAPIQPPSLRRPPPSNRPPSTRPVNGRHTPATARIQSRLERWELDHLRMLAAEQAERIEQLEDQVASANQQADWWRESHHELEAHLNDGTSDARCIGLTQQGEFLVVATGALQ